MNFFINRSSESSYPLNQSLPPESQAILTQQSSTKKQNQRHHPIPTPSDPRQYRAIGLIEAQYQQSSDLVHRGNLLTADGTIIDAVMLGRMMSVLKKHLDLEVPHLWVVYPRTRQSNDHLQLQIVGVWEPENLYQDDNQPDISPQEQSLIKHGYFSIRGEVIFSSPEKQIVIIKIRQAPKQKKQKAKFFKLKLKGILPDRPVSRFWDLQVQLQGDSLIIQQAKDLGFIRHQKPSNPRKKQLTPRGRRTLTHSHPLPPDISNSKTKPSKIIKKKIN
ncbi:hypothetical protein PCC7424_4499 [Gloeothece citriformis PCC 7424]|uniref:Uncharacterized protein n=1 Tax=Gloeothece citriformis (strain PCC 7424) TaxID=65393 RepID=B7KA89_GLOC7|nr:hypothetical protein [Gloeothece citriformis]ACK72863.1 hypothetical protein PCC7424_4499 [Gloeothece citriformis PCC 7424]